MADQYLGSQAPMYQNVHIQVRDAKTGKVRLERNAKNRVTKLMLWGIARFLSGEYNDSTPDKIYEVIPRYLALGSNTPKLGEDNISVTTAVSVNDTRLLNEYTVLTSTGASEPVKRISIQGRQHSKMTTHFSDPFVKLSLSTYINSEQFDGVEIGEAGLFSKETANNCLARVVFPTFSKQKGEVIDIQWDITLLSYGTTKYAESVSIAGPNKVTIGLEYTPYHIVTENIGLYRIKNENYLCDSNGTPLFQMNPSEYKITALYDKTTMATMEWAMWIEGLDMPYTFDYLYNYLTNCILPSTEDQIYYGDISTPAVFHLGDLRRISSQVTLLADNESNLLHDVANYQLVTDDAGTTMIAQEVLMSYIGVTEITYEKHDTGARLRATASPKDYVVEYNGDTLEYKVIDNQFYQQSTAYSSDYEPKDAYLYNNVIVSEERGILNYVYDEDSGIIYEMVVTNEVTTDTGAYLVKSEINNNKVFKIYCIKNGIETKNTGYWIAWENDKEVYYGDEDILYHVSTDNYFVIGETYQLKAVISPTDATDNSVTWTSVNPLVSKLNSYGVLHAWNVGETMAIVTTSNNLKARIIVQVVKNSTMQTVDSITLDPSSVTIQVDEPDTATHIVTAMIEPPFATYHTVEWKLDDAAAKLCQITALGNNKVSIHSPSGNIGRGYLIASTQDGKSAKCLITTQYASSNVEDCEDTSHDDQQA